MRSDPRTPVKTLPPVKWAIPIPQTPEGRRGDTERSMPYEAGNAALEALGFVRAHTQLSASTSTLAYMRDEQFEQYKKAPEEHSEEHAIWTHPSGVLALADSYTTGGYLSSETQRMVPRGRNMNSLTVYVQLDLGAGSNNSSVGFQEVRGSGGNAILMDGTNVRTVHTDVINGGEGLKRFLSQAQRFGKLLPFEQWDPTAYVYMDDEYFITVPVNEHTRSLSKEVLKEFLKEDLRAGQQRVIAKLPAGLKEVMAASVVPLEVKATISSRPWLKIEHTLEYFSQTMAAGGKRFPSMAMRQLHKHWSAVALGEVKGGADQWRWQETGPGGTHLPTALLYSNHVHDNHAKLMDLLLRAPVETLQTWLLPDADGYTLPLRVLERVIGGETFDVFSGEARVALGRFSDILSLIHERMGPEGFVLSSATRSAIGLLLEQPKHSSFESRRHEAAREVFFQLLQQMHGYGVEWMSDLRWTKPHHMLKEGEAPKTIRHDGAVTEAMLLDAFEPGTAPAAVKEVAVWVRSKELDAALPHPDAQPTPGTAARRRL